MIYELTENKKKLILSNKLKELLTITHNHDLLRIVDYLDYKELKKCYITILNRYQENPYFIKKNMEIGNFKI